MFKEIFSFELKMGFRKPSTYIYFALVFALTFFIGLAAAGVFATTRNDSNMLLNSAYTVAGILLGSSSSIFSLMVSILLISTMATAIQKDYQYNMHPLFFTKPITKPGYFFGRFLGAFTVAVFVFSGFLIGYYLGTLFGMGKPMMGEFKFINFIEPFLVFTLPNTFLFGAIFFALTTYFRNTMPAYIVAIVLMVISMITGNISSDLDKKMLSAIIEPSGMLAFRYVTEYWTPDDKNHLLIPLSNVLLNNRLLWTGVAILICAVSYYGFSFSQFLQPLNLFRRKETSQKSTTELSDSLATLPKMRQDFSHRAALQQTWALAKFECSKMVKSPFFVIMALLGIGMLFLMMKFMDLIYDTPTYPVTYQIVEQSMGAFVLFMLIFVIFYSGTTIWRERETKMDELIGATPVSNASLFFSKYIGLSLATILLSLIAALAGISVQLFSGFTHIDLFQYFVSILQEAVSSIILIGLCLAVQVYSPNKYLGFFLSLVPIMFIPIIFSLLEWDADLMQFNSSGASRPYSDMNGYGGSFTQWPFYKAYWISICAILALLALLLYPRGKEKTIKSKWQLSQYFNTPKFKALLGICAVSALAFGAFIFYETKILKENIKPKEVEKQSAEFEKKYKKYQALNQPRIIVTSINADIFPQTKKLHIAGTYILQNKTKKNIDTICFNLIGGEKSGFSYSKFEINVPNSLVVDDNLNGIKLMKLQSPLLPGDSLNFNFDMVYTPVGLFDEINSPVNANGTFIHNNLLPSIGYNPAAELSQNTARKEYGLPPKPRLAKVDDSLARMNNYISNDADWIRFDATISTDEGQIAIAPGYLQKDWTKDGRHYFQYKMDSPILNFYAFLSAAYTVKKDKWHDVNIEIYYTKGHEYNLDRMIKGIKKSLDYYTVNFGPYQHQQVRILEFPRYMSFAQSFPNTIPFSEAIGFIAKVEEGPDKIDVPFYITAHEVAHQWWAHQVIGGNVQGKELMSETMSQYCALMVMEKEYGKESMKKFLKYEMDKYLRARTMEGKGEKPLMLCENQQYIHYNKGSVIMYALQDYIGEEKLNAALRAYLEKNKFYGPMYTNSIEFVDYIRKAAPDSLQYIVRDMFEKITIYENYVKALDYKKLSDSSYKVTISVGSAKFYADSIGKQTKATVNDYMDIGVFGTQKINGKDEEKPLIFQRIKMDQPEKTFEFVVKEKPISAGLDPYLKLIDRTPKNNSYKFGEQPEKVNVDAGKAEVFINFGSKGDD